MIIRELVLFLIVGTLTVLIDFSIYRGLIWLWEVNLDVAKGAGFIAGTIFAYFANRIWTFGHAQYKSRSIWRFIVLYATTLCANVIVNAVILNHLDDAHASVQLAFLVATGISAALNFLGMKFFVFRSSPVRGYQWGFRWSYLATMRQQICRCC